MSQQAASSQTASATTGSTAQSNKATTQQAAATTTTTSSKSGGNSVGTSKNRHPGYLFIGVGIGLLVFWLLGVLAQIQTTEAFAEHGGAVSVFQPNWGILLQPLGLLFGRMSAADGTAAFAGWAVFFTFLTFMVVGVELLHHAATRSGRWIGKLFLLATLVIIGFDSWTDYQFGTMGPSGDAGHWIFAVMMFVVVGFFGTIGIFCIEYGWKHV